MPTKKDTVSTVGEYGVPASPAFGDFNQKAAEIRDYKADIVLDETLQPQPTGMTAQSVNQAAATQMPTSFSEFGARGGISNTAMQTVQNVRNYMNKKKLRNLYLQLLEAGKRGAEAAYNDAVSTYGQEVSDWIPESDYFVDEEGTFLPHKYYQALALGVRKFKQNKLRQQETSQAGEIVSQAATPQEAVGGVMQAGIEPTQFKGVYDAIPSIKDYSAVEKDIAGTEKIRQDMKLKPEMQKAQIDLLGQKGETEKARQWRLRNYLPSSGGGGGPGKPTYSQLASLNRAYNDANQRILNYNKEINDVKNDRRTRPEEKEALIQDLIGKRTEVERSLPKIENDLNALREALSIEPVVEQPQEAQSESQKILESIYDEVANQLGKYTIDNRFGRMMAYDGKGRPQSQKFNKEVKLQVQNLIQGLGLNEDSLPGLNLDEDIETKPHEDIIKAIILYNELMKRQGGVYQTPQVQ